MFFDNFSAFDNAVLSFFHGIVANTDGSLNGLVGILTALAKHGLVPLLIGAILFLFRKTRRSGVTVVFALAIGGLVTKLILKNLIFRYRPYDTSAEFYGWWQLAGSANESGSSFPSGHATVAAAFAVAMFMTLPKKWSWSILLFPVLIAATRLYLCVHYPTDVLCGIIVGALSGIAAYYIVKGIYKLMLKRSYVKAIKFYFEFSVTDLFKKKKERNE